MSKKYKLTEESVEVYGAKLFRIEALKDFGDVKKGDLGGYLEAENNLSHEGNYWFSENAQVSEKAWVRGHSRVSGDAQVTSNPINIVGLIYNVTAYCDFLQIGCELHKFSEWANFSDTEIAEMDGERATKFWKENKVLCLSLQKSK